MDIRALLLVTSLLAISVLPFPLHAAAPAIATNGSATSARIGGSLSKSGSSEATALFAEGQRLDLSFDLLPDASDVGAQAELFQVARYQEQWYMRTATGPLSWVTWNGDLSSLTPFDRRQLRAAETIRVLDGQLLAAGEYSVYTGYRSSKDARVVHNARPITFSVFQPENSQPTRFRSRTMLENYLLEAANKGIQYNPGAYSPTLGGATAGGVVNAAAADFSPTNLQESGVDEADSLKSDGRYVYMLTRCRDQVGSCVDIYQVTETPAANSLVNRVTLPGDGTAIGLYLLDLDKDAVMDTLIVISGSSYYPSLWGWAGTWSGTQTEILVYALPQPAEPALMHTLEFDGGLVSSRVIDDRLYLVTRFSPVLWDYPQLPLLHTGLSTADQVRLLPTLIIDGQSEQLLQEERCFMPPFDVDNSYPEATSVTLTAIPLTDPKAFESTSILGSSEALYASTSAIYLASTGYQTSTGGYRVLTNVHKFQLGDGVPEYRGSGSVDGHLGYEWDKKSFRMGEHQGVLRIATSVGEQWQGSSSTSVSLLSEAQDGSFGLVQRARLDNLGKPNEQLYAARFIGDRGFLVTFRTTDPLYILDLSDPDLPLVAGELEIEGYSDYLHPVSEDYLLGIGKHAVSTTSSGDSGRWAGTWYQGVKLSLFDISDPTSPTEVDNLILGKRGTQSDVLHDHHALAHLPAHGGASDRVAIPVELHDRIPNSPYFDASDPTTWYDWTHTALYVFDIQTGASPGINLSFVVPDDNQSISYPGNNGYGDRSLLLGDSTHYAHQGLLYSAQTPRAAGQ